MWRGPSAVSTEFGPTIGRSGDSPASDGASSGFAVKSERTWSGWLVMTRPPGIDAAHPEDFAELAAGAEDELDLALVEAQRSGQRGWIVDDRRRREALGLLRIAGLGAAAGALTAVAISISVTQIGVMI